jgi:hypothetical protein
VSDSESTQAGQRRRPIGTALIVGLAILVVVSTVVVAVRFVRGAGDGEKQVVYADGAGGLSATLPGYDYRVAAPPDTFPAGERLEVKRAEKTPDIGRGKFLGTPIEITSRVQPAHPVSLEISYSKVNLELTVGTLWDKDAKHFETAPIERTEDGDLRIYLKHVSGGGIVAFPSLDALTQWHAGPGADAAIKYLEDFFDFPYECPAPTFESKLLGSEGYPSRSVNTQLNVNDKQIAKSTVTLQICNPLRFAMEYKATGAGEAEGFSLPRSTVPHDVHLQGVAGDAFKVETKFTPKAFTVTLVFLMLPMLPYGRTMMTKPQFILKGLTSPSGLTLIANSARSCDSSINAALRTPGATTFDGAVSCLQNLSSFNEAFIDLWRETAVELGLEVAAEQIPVLGPIMRGQVWNRIGAELYHFGLPRDVSFPYRLLCAEGSDIACPKRATDPQAAVPKQPGTRPARPPTQPDTDSPPVCTAGDRDNDGVCDDVDTCTGGGADLEPTAITYEVPVVQAGQRVYFDSGVENQAVVDSGVFSIKWLVDGQEVGAYGGHDGVPAKSTVMDGNSQFTWTFDSPGTYTLTFAVDVDDHVQCEANESDNVRYKTVQVQQAANEEEPEEAAPTPEETPTTEPSETPTSAPTETATASTPEPSEAATATTAPGTTPSASVPFYTLGPTP